MSNEHKQSDLQPIKVFISHATADEPLAAALVDLFQSALALPPGAIRCTSVTGYGLPGGTSVDEQLRRDVSDANAFIGIISYQSLRSPYVLFELGARWGATRHLIPVLAPGIGPEVLIAPLSGLHALKTDRDGLTQLVEDLGSELNLDQTAPTTYQQQINRVLGLPPAAPPDTSTTNGDDHAIALSPDARELLVAAAKSRNGAVLIFKLMAGTAINCDNKQFVELGNPRSEAQWKRAAEDLQQAGFIESPEGWSVRHGGSRCLASSRTLRRARPAQGLRRCGDPMCAGPEFGVSPQPTDHSRVPSIHRGAHGSRPPSAQLQHGEPKAKRRRRPTECTAHGSTTTCRHRFDGPEDLRSR